MSYYFKVSITSQSGEEFFSISTVPLTHADRNRCLSDIMESVTKIMCNLNREIASTQDKENKGHTIPTPE